MSKKILIVYYSQSGQLKQIAENFTKPLVNGGIDLDWVAIKPKKDFPFPWSKPAFFNVMPESVLGIATEIEEPIFKHSNYDLIVFAWQPWFLSLSIPASSMLQNPTFKKILQNTPLVTLVGGRNMWINANEQLRALLKSAGANWVANIVLKDRNPNLISAITIQHWMFTGKKDNLYGLFPKPGISDYDIENVKFFGEEVFKVLESGKFIHLQQNLIDAKAIEVNTNLMFIESRASKIFSVWANIILKKENRTLWLKIFRVYLTVALFCISPFVILIFVILFKPFSGGHIRKKKTYHMSVS